MLCVPAVLTAPLAAQQEPERVVRQLDFVGNHAIDDYTLGTVIATSKSSWFARAALVRSLGLGAKRYFDELEFRRDVVRLIIYYRQSGYMQVVVDTSVRRTPRDAYITFRIFEGQPVRVRHLDVTGIAGIVNERPLLRAMPLKVGDPFNRFLMQASADTLAAWLRNRGFPYAQVLRNFDAEAAELAADISFEAVPGPFMRVGDIVVDGLRRLDTTTVLRMLSVHPGETYREDLLYRSQRDLYGTGMFRAATVGMRDTMPPQNGDTTVDLVVSVAEGPRQRIGLGAGYGSLDCFRAQGGWSSYGFLGDARVLNLSTRVSKIGVGAPLDLGFSKPGSVCFPLEGDSTSDTLNYNVALTLLQPTFLSPSHSASIGVFAERRSEFKTYTRIQIGANAGVTFNARRRVPLGLAYGYSVGRTVATDAAFCSVFNVCDDSTLRSLRDPHPFASLTLTAALRTEDFTLDPTRGGHVGITLLHASRLLGSDRLYEFNRGEIEVARYIPFGRYGVFAWRVHAGALFPARITVSPGQSALFVPPDQRFYAGGPNSVRGYAANGLGPQVYVLNEKDTTDITVVNGDTVYNQARRVATGGNSVVLANAEVRVRSPVWPDRVRLAAFVDVGQVYRNQNETFSFRALRITPGAGVRVTTPLGPVRVDVAYNGYDYESGVLKLESNNALIDYRPNYQPPRSASFFQRLTLQFAIGQAF
ncbi:MAG TPA: BamA/TamA family outer membrane protein [Gemmatimonadales bacterium]